MPQPTYAPTDKDWASAFNKALNKGKQPPKNEGWLTRVQLGQKFGLSNAAIRRRITEMMKLGVLDTFQGSELRGGTRSYAQIWYRPAKTAPIHSKPVLAHKGAKGGS